MILHQLTPVLGYYFVHTVEQGQTLVYQIISKGHTVCSMHNIIRESDGISSTCALFC